jgi:hypothetical protein
LGNNFSNNWEVKNGEINVMYIKTTSIDTVDLTGASGALVCMQYGLSSVG